MPKGRGFGSLAKGERITSMAQLHVGAIVLVYSPQFDAENTIRVTQSWDDRVYYRFVNPENPSESWSPEHSLFYFELGRDDVWLAVFPIEERAPEPPVTDLPLFAKLCDLGHEGDVLGSH